MTDEELIAGLAAALEDADRRRPLVDYWFERQGGGWVRPDWVAIASLAVQHIRAEEGSRSA